MRNACLIAVCLISARFFAQITFVPTTTMPCNAYTSIVNFTILAGNAPYTFTVETPSCNTTFTASSLTANAYFTVGCQGVYTLTVNDVTSSFSASATHSVVYETFVDVGIAPDKLDATICEGYTMSLLAGSHDDVYSVNPVVWSTGETSLLISVSPSVTTSYSYTGVSSYPMITRTCTAVGTITVFIITCNYLGLNTKDLTQLDFKIYPNPVKDKLYLEVEQSEIKLEISDAVGQTVFILNEPQAKQEIDVSFLDSGIYFVKTQNKEGQRVIKIIKE